MTSFSPSPVGQFPPQIPNQFPGGQQGGPFPPQLPPQQLPCVPPATGNAASQMFGLAIKHLGQDDVQAAIRGAADLTNGADLLALALPQSFQLVQRMKADAQQVISTVGTDAVNQAVAAATSDARTASQLTAGWVPPAAASCNIVPPGVFASATQSFTDAINHIRQDDQNAAVQAANDLTNGADMLAMAVPGVIGGMQQRFHDDAAQVQKTVGTDDVNAASAWLESDASAGLLMVQR